MFGLANAPMAFMCMMHRILHLYHWNTIVYLVDVFIFSQILAAYKAHVEGILMALRNACLWLNGTKYVFGMLETSFVGFRVNRDGIYT